MQDHRTESCSTCGERPAHPFSEDGDRCLRCEYVAVQGDIDVADTAWGMLRAVIKEALAGHIGPIDLGAVVTECIVEMQTVPIPSSHALAARSRAICILMEKESCGC